MVSNKEIEAALSAFLAEYGDSSAEWWHYRKEVIAALSAAARVRAEDNTGEPVGEITQECRYCANTGWFYGDPGLETFCGCSFGEVRKDASSPAPQPSGPVEALEKASPETQRHKNYVEALEDRLHWVLYSGPLNLSENRMRWLHEPFGDDLSKLPSPTHSRRR